MIEIENILLNKKQKESISISLFGKLEAIVGNYFLSEVTYGVYGGLWNSIYYNPSVNYETEGVACVPENLIGYVDKEIRWAFILNKYIKKFKKDTAEFNLDYISVPSLQEEILQCCHTDKLPREFLKILWIDDDFMNDETIPFDFDMFAIIDEDKNYLNPKHFSVSKLIKLTQTQCPSVFGAI